MYLKPAIIMTSGMWCGPSPKNLSKLPKKKDVNPSKLNKGCEEPTVLVCHKERFGKMILAK